MEQVKFGSDFKNQPRIGQRFIQSTAGAVSVKTKKGDLVVQKVNVKRYIAGKKPEWAPDHSSEEESEEEDDENEEAARSPTQIRADDLDDEIEEKEEENQDHGRRRIYEPRVVTQHEEEEMEEEDENDLMHRHMRQNVQQESSEDENEEEADEELDEEAIERRRQIVRARAQLKKVEDKDLLDIEDEEELEEDESEDESSEYEEDSDSDEESGLRLKPVFVRKTDRVTIQERERMQEENALSEDKIKKVLEDRKKYSTKLVSEIIKEGLKETQGVTEEEQIVITDDENDEEEYESWKVRELKRIKRDKEEKESREREKLEVERLRNMTEDQRREEARRNPKVITNKSSKGKYKFLQKYYHRGAFFMDKEEHVYTRDFTGATLEDHFDKTVLPKAMQVKNFGRSGRTKYTHLVDQDTTEAESPWFAESAQSLKFHAKVGGGNKQTFERPSRKKK